MSASDDATTTPAVPAQADREEDLTATYVKIVILEVATILLLWWFGKAFS